MKNTSLPHKTHCTRPTIAVAFLARGADSECTVSFQRFVESYRRYRAGIDHTLYVLFKGYTDTYALDAAKQIFSNIAFKPVFLDDDSLDIGAYIKWSAEIRETFMCPLNSTSEILCDDWLLKLFNNLLLHNVGLVGVTASFESLRPTSKLFPPFPNPHIRTSGFMIRKDKFQLITRNIKIRNKSDAFYFESGPNSMTRKVLESGQKALLVGRNGRGYSPRWWPVSETFRQELQSNLLIADKQTRDFSSLPWRIKCHAVGRTWCRYIDGKKTLCEKYNKIS